MSKSLFTSRTFLLAVLQAVAGAVVIFTGAYPEVGWLALAKSVLDVILRVVTDKPVHVA